ncbi:MAG TPA: SurA N-terminal domain-containing protein [Candidatus Methylomirabilis sp.]|nr:SurA N-terminal domain-containing protein [Candidatus Methylomirabilis sp.]
MLSTIREKTQGIIATFILLLIVIPFALWGINSYFESGSKLDVATVNGVDISQVSYHRVLDQLRGRVDPATFDSRQFKEKILDSLVEQTLLVQDAREQGYRVSDARLAETIRSLPYFQRDGKFDTTMYEAVLRNQGMTPQEFERRLREQSITGQIQAGLSESGIVTDADVAQVARRLSQQREVAYAVINLESLMTKMSVDEKDIEKYYAEHTDLFQTPEQVRVAYLRLSSSDLNQDYQPTEDDLKKAYADEAARYVVPAVHRASHILISLPPDATEAQAKAALAKIEDIAKQARAGADFAGLAKKYSQDSATAVHGGDLGVIHPGILPKSLESAVFAMSKPGEISQPVRTSFGYHLIKLTAYTAEKRRPFAEVRKDLVQLVRRRKGEEKYFDVSEKFRNLVYEQPDSLAPAAKALGLTIQKSDWFTRAGGAGIAANPKVVQAAFQPDVLSGVRNSDAIDFSDDTLVAVRVTDRKPAARKPLNDVRAEIERVLKQEQAQKAGRRLAETWLAQLRADDGRLDALAKRSGFKYQSPKMLMRSQNAGVDPRIVDAAFRAPRPDGGKAVYDLVDLGGRGYAVFALERVLQPSGKAMDSTESEARRILAAQRGAGYYAYYRAGLREKAKIKIFADQL